MEYVIEEKDAGMTIRQYLGKYLPVSTKMLKFMKYREDGILVGGERKTVRYVLRAGDVLSLAVLDREPSAAVEPVDLPIGILYEDDDIVVPAKPAGMPTHPSHDHRRDTVANALAFRYRERGIPFVFRPVNRLDRNTSGLLLIARNKLAAGLLTEAMQAGRIRKSYLAILDGEMTVPGGVIDACLHRTAESIIVREVCSPDAPDADPARTVYEVLAAGNGHTLVLAHPVTGRTHQLRVHFSSVGFPITGDDLYGKADARIARQALHAYQLTFPLPSTGEDVTFLAPLPEDFSALLRAVFPGVSETLPDLMKGVGRG